MGVYRYANGDIYEGEFLLDEFHGRGKYTGVNGIVYEGEFLQGARVCHLISSLSLSLLYSH
jgi:hypothetical protein